MKQMSRWALVATTVTALAGATGCSSLSERERATAIGAGVGGVAESVLTGGGTVGTVGGAVVGGVVGNEVGKRREGR